MPKLAASRMGRRDRIETVQTHVMASQVRLKQVRLRCQQAMKRHNLDDLLEPAVRGLDATLGDLDQSQKLLSEEWQEKERQGWPG